jgi:hypothetical protein
MSNNRSVVKRTNSRKSQTSSQRLRSEIGQLGALYYSGAMPPGVYVVLKRMGPE